MGKKILLADDSITIQKVISITFATEDYELIIASNGDEALQKALETKPDLIMADIVMPGKTGYQVCEAVKGHPSLNHIPVLLLAGTFEPINPAEAQRVGANDHILKPFESDELLNKVKHLLSGGGAAPAQAPAQAPAIAPPVVPAASPPVAPAAAPPMAPPPVAPPVQAAPPSVPMAPPPAAPPSVPMAPPPAAPEPALGGGDDFLDFSLDEPADDVDDSMPTFEMPDEVAATPAPVAAPPVAPPTPPPSATSSLWDSGDFQEGAETPAPAAAPPVTPPSVPMAAPPVQAAAPAAPITPPPAQAAPPAAPVNVPDLGSIPKQELEAAVRQIIEQVVWEVVPDLAEEILKTKAEEIKAILTGNR